MSSYTPSDSGEAPSAISTKPKAKAWKPLLGLGILTILAFGIRALPGKPQPAAPAVTPPSMAPQPTQPARVAFVVTGKIAKLAAVEGQMVQKGDLIAILDPAPFEGAVKMAEANLVKAKTETQQAVAKLAPPSPAEDSSWVKNAGKIDLSEERLTGTVASATREHAALEAAQARVAKVQADGQAADAAVQTATERLSTANEAVNKIKAEIPIAEADAKAAESKADAAEAARDKAKKDDDRFQMLLKDGVVSAREAGNFTAKYKAASAAADSAHEEAQAATALIEQRHEELETAQSKVAEAEAQLAKAKEAVDSGKAAVKSAGVALQQASAQYQTASNRARSDNGRARVAMNSIVEGNTAPVQVQINQDQSAPAKSKVEQAEIALQQARGQLEAIKIYAPISGRIHWLVGPNVEVKPGQSVVEITPSEQPRR